MAESLGAAPVLSTPDTHILNDTSDIELLSHVEKLSEEQLAVRYEISRTINEIRQQRWRRVALQFPDDMLPHSAKVYQMLARGLKYDTSTKGKAKPAEQSTPPEDRSQAVGDLQTLSINDTPEIIKLTILADTSYGACCVDEIAAEHVDADAVVHYGRACLSPTARLPVLHIFTHRDLDVGDAVNSFRSSFPDMKVKVIVTADVPYSESVLLLCLELRDLGYDNIFEARIIRQPSSPIPNRTVPTAVSDDPSKLSEWHLFHISEPPTSLLLTLISNMASIKVFSTDSSVPAPSSDALQQSTSILLRRRYALVTSLSTVAVWGILINTLSIKNYLHMVDHVKKQIADAGKKSYMFVVGKINAAKVANFSDIGGWVVIGCWESSLIDSKEFYKPIVTPFELELALSNDKDRVWSGNWRSDFESVIDAAKKRQSQEQEVDEHRNNSEDIGNASDDDSDEAPEFDLRTGRYVSKTRPMGRRQVGNGLETTNGSKSNSLTRRANGDMAVINGVASPAAQHLNEKRTWRGLGSDFEIKYDDEEEQGNLIEEGRSGMAGGYIVADSTPT